MLQEITNLTKSLTLAENLKVPSHKELIDGLSSLKNEYPDKIEVSFDGKSRNGKKLIYTEIGNGEKVIAVTSGAHADEPTGILTSFNLIINLLENKTFEELLSSYKFIFHPMLDPDGAEINYEWAKDEFSYKNYLTHSFRNKIPFEDCEHGIPANEKQDIRPELDFFKKNIDKFKGKIVYYITMHTTHRLGGSLFVLSTKRDPQSKVDLLTKICEEFSSPVCDLDLHGQDGIEHIAPGFLTAPPMAKMAEKFKDKPEILSQIKLPTYEYVEHQ